MIATLEAKERRDQGTNRARSMRRAGQVPAVVYGRGEPSRNLELDSRTFNRLLETIRGRIPIVEVKLPEGEPFKCIIKSIQKHPVTGQLLHVDFQKIHPTEKLTVTVPIGLVGEAPGIKQGGTLDHHLREVGLRGLIDAIPTHIEVDVSALKIGQSIHLRDLGLTGVEALVAPETPVVSVLVPKKVEEPTPTAEAPAEPEVIGAKKEEGAEEEAAEGGEAPKKEAPKKEKEEKRPEKEKKEK